MSEVSQKSAGYKRNKFMNSRFFGRFSTSAKQSTSSANKPFYSFDDSSRQNQTQLDRVPDSWEVGEGSTEDELLFIFPDHPQTPLHYSDPEDDVEADDERRKSNSEEIWQQPASNPLPIRHNAPHSPVDKHIRPKSAHRRKVYKANRENVVDYPEITLQMRLMRTQNVWCIPDLSRAATEQLLTNADPGVSYRLSDKG
ncbi:hypothetical protein FBUS_00746 [Fasciolopsis buskii]|uniref:Uncharacterized protein n=1 Tax=Fasciolopsis buskii TaxID=27845 RepID=A0A8E0RJP0_9TREM|nr:hypothetical protein FBUS_00746 [Fasciolopsis buski]